MTDRYVSIETDEPVAILRFVRPPVNAIDLEAAKQISEAFDELAADAGIGAILLTGSGTSFSAGVDLKLVPRYGADQQRAMVEAVNGMLGRLYASAIPVVAAVNGHAIAGGLVLALACDYRIGVREPCRMGLTEARVGIPYPAAAMAVVQAELSHSRARNLVLMARNLDSEQAFAYGILDELVPRDGLMERALECARDLAAMPRVAYGRIKQQLRADTIARIDEVNAKASDPMLDRWLTGDSATAAAAVLSGERDT
jgi:enoyl-CoA hydratase